MLKRRVDGVDDARTVAFGGVGLVADGYAAVYADTTSALGGAIDLAHRHGAPRLYFFCELNSPEVARRASHFSLPTTVVSPDGETDLLPDPFASSAELALPTLSENGLDVVSEHGVVTAEVLGLEVARLGPDGWEVGVGRLDRELNQMLEFGDLAAAAEIVRRFRRADAPIHPANQLVQERWLRAVLVRNPALIGEGPLEPVAPAQPRDDLHQRAIAPARGADVVVACSVGVDPDLVPQAADVRAREHVDRLVIAVPEGDDHPLTHRLCALLNRPAESRTVPAGWRAP